MSEKDSSRPKLFIVGATGTVGSAVRKVAQEQGFAILAPSRQDLDLVRSSYDELERIIAQGSPGVFINCAVARATIDQAEREKGNRDGVVWQTNAIGPEKIAKICQSYGIPFIHFSTDYVLGGSLEQCPHNEDEKPSPTSWYAASKAESEQRVLNACERAHIVRIQRPFTYNPAAKRGDILRDAYKAIQGGETYLGIVDQSFSPGLDLNIATAVLEIAQSSEYGIWHVSSPIITTPYDIISLALAKLVDFGVKLDQSLLEEANFADFAKRWGNLRPQHTAFDVSKFENRFGTGILKPIPEAVEEWAKGFVANLGYNQ